MTTQFRHHPDRMWLTFSRRFFRAGTNACLVAASVLMAGCGGDAPAPREAKMPVPQHQLDALEKAKQVEQKLQEDAERREREMRERGT